MNVRSQEFAAQQEDYVQASRAELIGRLKDIFSTAEADVVLKGSIVRANAPYGDADVVVIGDPKTEIESPARLLGTELSITRISKELFASCLDVTPRDWYVLNENIVIKAHDPEVADHIALAKDRMAQSRMPDYLLYLAVEHMIYWRNLHLDDDDYFSQKRQPGSKRSIMRGLMIAKTMYPAHLETEQTTDLIDELHEAGHLPMDIAADMADVNRMLRSRSFEAEWNTKTANVETWVQELVKKAFNVSKGFLPTDYITAVETGLYGDINPQTLSMISGVGLQSERHRQWVLDLLLAANPHYASRSITGFMEEQLWCI